MSVHMLDYIFHNYLNSLKLERGIFYIDNKKNITSAPTNKSIDIIDYITAIGTIVIYHQEKYMKHYFMYDADYKKTCQEIKLEINYLANHIAYIVENSDVKKKLFLYGYHTLVNCMTESAMSNINENINIGNRIFIIDDNTIEMIHGILVGTILHVAKQIITENNLKLFIKPDLNVTEIADENSEIETWFVSEDKWDQIKYKTSIYLNNLQHN